MSDLQQTENEIYLERRGNEVIASIKIKGVNYTKAFDVNNDEVRNQNLKQGIINSCISTYFVKHPEIEWTKEESLKIKIHDESGVFLLTH